MNATIDIEELRTHELVILRRLRSGPLTEFELAVAVAESTGYTTDDATDFVGDWLMALQALELCWVGKLFNSNGQSIHAAALTRRGRQLVG